MLKKFTAIGLCFLLISRGFSLEDSIEGHLNYELCNYPRNIKLINLYRELFVKIWYNKRLGQFRLIFQENEARESLYDFEIVRNETFHQAKERILNFGKDMIEDIYFDNDSKNVHIKDIRTFTKGFEGIWIKWTEMKFLNGATDRSYFIPFKLYKRIAAVQLAEKIIYELEKINW